MTKSPLPPGPVARQRFFVPPGAPFLEIRTTMDSTLPYAAHVHSAFSLGLILQGCTRFTLDGATHLAHEGDMVLIAQGSAHSCNPVDGPRGYHMLLMDVDWLRRHMGDELRLCPPLIRDAALFAKAKAVMQALLADREHAADMLVELLRDVRARHGGAGGAAAEALGASPMAGMAGVTGAAGITGAARAAGLAGFTEMAKVAKVAGVRGVAGATKAGMPGLAKVGGVAGATHAMDALNGGDALNALNVTDSADGAPPLSVAGLARAAGMRRESFSRAVRRSTGLPPSRYLHCLRLDKARRLLRQGKSIIEAALAAGYADQSHFHRMFVRFYAVTPGRYRACHIRTRKRR